MLTRCCQISAIGALCLATSLVSCAFDTNGINVGVRSDARDASFDDSPIDVDAAGDTPIDNSADRSPDTPPDSEPDTDAGTCANGVKDGDETDTDCGGSCSPCAVGRTCSVSADCAPNICPSSKKCALPQSCAQIHSVHPSAATGDYALAISTTSVTTRCEMDTDGGGWTLVQRTTWTWANNTAQLLTNFSDFYTQSAGSLANAWRIPGNVWSSLLAAGDVLAIVQVRKANGTSCPSLYYKNSGATLSANVGTKTMTFSGLTGSPKLFLANDLSTLDSGPASGCVVKQEVVPGFYGTCCQICPSFGGGYWADSPHPMAQEFSLQTSDLFAKTLGSSCASTLTRASTYVGLNSLELYLR